MYLYIYIYIYTYNTYTDFIYKYTCILLNEFNIIMPRVLHVDPAVLCVFNIALLLIIVACIPMHFGLVSYSHIYIYIYISYAIMCFYTLKTRYNNHSIVYTIDSIEYI